ncbi:MAG: hypothetical protein AAFP03_17350 [Cyanobacteria bacterium J06598_3]
MPRPSPPAESIRQERAAVDPELVQYHLLPSRPMAVHFRGPSTGDAAVDVVWRDYLVVGPRPATAAGLPDRRPRRHEVDGEGGLTCLSVSGSTLVGGSVRLFICFHPRVARYPDELNFLPVGCECFDIVGYGGEGLSL